MKYSTQKHLIETKNKYKNLSDAVGFLNHLSNQSLKNALKIVDLSKAQIQQDIFVLALHDFKKKGYFVEFGATNGIDFSNTWLMERKYDWEGIVAEPSKQWHNKLQYNRQCHISDKCVWKTSNENLTFNEIQESGFSTIDRFTSSDHHVKSRKNGSRYDVKTISLNDLLSYYNAPIEIDYLSIDTEGSEFEILSTLDFYKWDISIITVEHNFTDCRDKIKKLLEGNDYKRVLTTISQFDDWYVKSHLIDEVYKKFNLKAQG